MSKLSSSIYPLTLRTYLFAGIILSVFFASMAYASIVSGSFTIASSAKVRITQLVMTRPSAMDGDLLLAAVAVNGGAAAAITAPPGWTLLQRADHDTNISLITYYKFASGSEPTSYTWSIMAQTNAQGSMTAYGGVNKSHPFDDATTAVGSASTARAAPVTTHHDGDRVIAVFAADVGKAAQAGNYFTAPVGMTEKYDTTNTPFGPSLAADETVQAVAGQTLPWVSDIAGKKARNWAAQTIALNSAQLGIVFDNAAKIHWQDPTTIDFTVGTGTNRALIVCEYTNYDSALPPALDGVPLTLVGKSSYRGFANLGIAAYVMTNPPSGVRSLAFNTTQDVVAGFAASYSGVDQATPIDGFSTAGVTDQSTIIDTVTTTTPNDWIIMCPSSSKSLESFAASGPVRVYDSTLAGALADTGSGVSPGTNPFSFTDNVLPAPGFMNDILFALRPAL